MDSIYHTSDYVLVLHRPELLGIEKYGTNSWPVKDLVYGHFLKNKMNLMYIKSTTQKKEKVLEVFIGTLLSNQH